MKHDGSVSMDTTSNSWTLVLSMLFVLGRCAEDNPRIIEHPTDHYVAKNEPAKLHCKAEGDPTPEITWYRNGQRVITNKDDQNAHRLLLNGGNQLFFLRIIHTKNLKPDVGTYYCNATNIHGSAISLNATLQIAVLRDDFRESPESVTVATGEKASFHCRPPRGEPEPKVLWHKEGNPVTPDSRVSISDEGDLTFSAVKVVDAGKYTCLAINQGGEKESSPATLTVLEKPTFREMPDDVQALVDDIVELKCRTSGEPTPTIQWRREDGRVPFGRARQLDDGTLRIEKVQESDDGMYICVAENSAGTAEAVGRLSVQTLPTFLIKPMDMSVGRGRTATLQCVVTGNPTPTVFWSKGKEQLLMFPHQDHGRFLVSEDGTLRIEDVEYHDEGTFVCQALNSLSNSKVSSVSAVITVLDQDDRPPPIIMAGPQNLTLEPKEVAVLPCQAEGDPQPTIRWYKDGKTLMNSDPRVAILSSGTLQVSDVRVTDSGMYTCKAISETGETDWIASLSISKTGPFQRVQKPTALPGAPSKPRISDVTDTSVHLAWLANEQTGQSQGHVYVVQYFSPQTSEGWQTATDSVSKESYSVKDLQPNSKYLFLVRVKTALGVSLPSPISDYVTTREKRHTSAANMPREEISKEFSALNIELKTGEAINATTLRVKWEVGASLAAIEGYVVNYTHITDLDFTRRGESQSLRIENPYQFKAYITDLLPFSKYEVCVQAYARDLISKCSNPMKVSTNESVPAAPPENIVIHEEDNSFHIRWSPPPRHQQNGEVKGYDIYCMAEDSNKNCSTTAGGRDSSAVVLNVDTEGSYRIKIAARTSKGRGVWSKDFIMRVGVVGLPCIRPDLYGNPYFTRPEHTDITSEPWFIWMLVGTVGGTLWVALCVFSVWLCKRRRRNKKKKKMAHSGMYSAAVPVHKSEESARAGSVMARQDTVFSQKEGTIHGPYGGLQSDLTSLLECGGHKDGIDSCQVYSSALSMPPMKTFYQRPGGPSAVAPYATTTLINKGGNTAPRTVHGNVTDSSFRPINHAYVQSSTSGSADSCDKPDLRSSESNTDSSRRNTGHYSYAGCPHDHCDGVTSPDSDSESVVTDECGLPIKHKYSKIRGCSSCGQGKQAVVNWSELLPPPPEHPPPSELGSSDQSRDFPHRRHSNNNSNITDNNRFLDNRSVASPVSKISACSCPVQNDRSLPHLRGNAPYSDFDYPSLPRRYHGDMARTYMEGSSSGSNHNSDRPYSPNPQNSIRPQTADTLLHHYHSLRSCHNCGTSIQQQQSGLQLPKSSSSSSSSYNNPHNHHHNHAPVNSETFMAVNHRLPNGDITDSRGGAYSEVGGACPQMGGAYPQGNVSTSFTQTVNGQCQFNPASPYSAPSALHGYRMPSMDPGQQWVSNDFEHFQGQVYSGVKGHEGLHADWMFQPSLNSEAVKVDGGRPESSTSEGVLGYADESDMDVHRATDGHTPDSSINGDGSVSDTDFISAVARASELSGLASTGASVTDPIKNSSKRYKSHKSAAEAYSPYGGDSNTGSVSRRPYPKSERKKQLIEQARKYGQRKDGGMQEADDTGAGNVKT